MVLFVSVLHENSSTKDQRCYNNHHAKYNNCVFQAHTPTRAEEVNREKKKTYAVPTGTSGVWHKLANSNKLPWKKNSVQLHPPADDACIYSRTKKKTFVYLSCALGPIHPIFCHNHTCRRQTRSLKGGGETTRKGDVLKSHTHIHAYLHTCTYTHPYIHVYKHTHTNIHTYMHMHAYKHTHTYKHIYMQTYTQTSDEV